MNEFQGTALQELVKNLIYSFSGLGMGAALYLVARDLKNGVQAGPGHVRRLWFARALFAGSFVGIMGLLTFLIYQSQKPLSLDWKTITFTALVVNAAFGALGTAWEMRKVREEDEKE